MRVVVVAAVLLACVAVSTSAQTTTCAASSSSATASAPTTAPAPVDTTPLGLVKRMGYTLAPDSLQKLLAALARGGDDQAAQRFIRELGDSSADTREAAMDKLIALPVVPQAALQQAAASSDPEVSTRARQVLVEAKGLSAAAALEQVLELAAQQEIKGLAAALLDEKMLPTPAWRRALLATVTLADEARLRKAIGGADRFRSETLQEARFGAMGDRAVVELEEMIKGKNRPEKLLAARVLAQRGDRRALKPLVELLDSVDPEHRVQGHLLLTALTGQKIDYEPQGSKQGSGFLAWQKWVTVNGASAKLVHPLVLGERARFAMLVSVHVKDLANPQNPRDTCEIWSIDAAGKATLIAKEGVVPWGVWPTRDGNVLVADFGAKSIYKITPFGRKLTEIKDLPAGPMRAVELPDGHILAALSDAKKVIEYDAKGEVKWEASFNMRVADARRLRNGNTLVALHVFVPEAGWQPGGRVVEVDEKGKEVWSLTVPHGGTETVDPQSVQRLANGGTLVAQPAASTVVEYDKDGKATWSYESNGITDAFRRADGTTVVATSAAIVVVNQKGQVLQTIDMKGVTRIWAE